MHHKWNLPEVFLAISVALVAVEGMLAGFSLIHARYRAADTLAWLAM
jgi:hypothetical protein